NAKAERETVIYLDNSFSLQARGTNGILLKRSLQELLEHLPEKKSFSLFLNNQEFKNVNLDDIREELQEITFSPVQPDWKSVQLKALNLFSENRRTQKDFIAISDFQKKENSAVIQKLEGIRTHLVQLLPENRNNISIDTAFISEKSLDEKLLEIHFSGSGEISQEIPVSIYDADNLLGRKSISLNENKFAITTFKLPPDPVENGKISIDDAGLAFDNELFFSINKTDPINVAVISNSDAAFLKRIYSSPEFNLQIFPEEQIDFNRLSEANLVILNEMEEIPGGLTGILKKLVSENVYVIIIPSEYANLENYNSFFLSFGMPVFGKKIMQERLITDIAFANPLFKNVFNEKVENFQYPKVQSYFPINDNEISVLGFENEQAFLFQKNNIFVFTAALNKENSNFQNSPLIVPSFYNIGKLALTPSLLYYNLGENNVLDVKVELEPDEILELSSADYSFIPLQQSFQNKVEIQLQNVPESAGHYSIKNDSVTLKTISFNINRKENRLEYEDLTSVEGVKVTEKISQVFQDLKSETEIHSLWKWFVIFALFFLLTEMLILKYFK
ncbi:MAG TPA: hypothetical protein VFM59_08190, partial [Salinimicrobium sp.]|nr:hypothetical protein [Salinimicrobium sp.]